MLETVSSGKNYSVNDIIAERKGLSIIVGLPKSGNPSYAAKAITESGH